MLKQGVTDMSMIGKMVSTVMAVISGSIEHAQVSGKIDRNMKIYKNMILMKHGTIDLVKNIFPFYDLSNKIK